LCLSLARAGDNEKKAEQTTSSAGFYDAGDGFYYYSGDAGGYAGLGPGPGGYAGALPGAPGALVPIGGGRGFLQRTSIKPWTGYVNVPPRSKDYHLMRERLIRSNVERDGADGFGFAPFACSSLSLDSAVGLVLPHSPPFTLSRTVCARARSVWGEKKERRRLVQSVF